MYADGPGSYNTPHLQSLLGFRYRIAYNHIVHAFGVQLGDSRQQTPDYIHGEVVRPVEAKPSFFGLSYSSPVTGNYISVLHMIIFNEKSVIPLHYPRKLSMQPSISKLRF
jgi:hypothetical protein